MGDEPKKQLTNAEKSRYDRQIRLWGAAAQSRLQNSKVLICGLYSHHIEVIKNIVLAGVNVVLYDGNATVMPDDLQVNYFLTAEDLGASRLERALPRIQDLNTLSEVGTLQLKDGLLGLTAEDLKPFSIVLMGDCYNNVELQYATAQCEQSGVLHFVSGGWMLNAWFVSCLGKEYQYRNDPPNNKDIHTLSYPSYNAVVGASWHSLVTRHFPLSPVFVKSRIIADFPAHWANCNKGGGQSPLRAVLLQFIDDAFTKNGIDITASSSGSSSVGSSSSINNNGSGSSCGGDGVAFAPILSTADVEEVVQVVSSRLNATRESSNGAGGDSNDDSSGVLVGCPVVVCSVVGSILSQEVIKTLSLVGEPMNNVFVYDGAAFEGKTFKAADATGAAVAAVGSATSSSASINSTSVAAPAVNPKDVVLDLDDSDDDQAGPTKRVKLDQ